MNNVVTADMKVLMNHIYEYQKGVRQMVLYTFNKKHEVFAVTRLQKQLYFNVKNVPFLSKP